MRYILYLCLYLPCLPILYAQTPVGKLEITPLQGDFYVFTTYQKLRNIAFPANGLYLVTQKGIVMIDTPWDSTQFQPLLEAIEQKHKKEVIICIATHFHEDRTGGFAHFRRQGIQTFASQKTDSLCQARGENRPEFVFAKDTTFKVGGYKFQTHFAGEGHTKDNIVVWFGKQKILYGGCLIKSTEAEDMGFTGDGNLEAWAGTIQHLQKKYPKIRAVITGHQKWDKGESLAHTLKLLSK